MNPELKQSLFTNLTFNELKNIQLFMGGELRDEEGIFQSRSFKCIECTSETPVNTGAITLIMSCRLLKFVDMSTTQNSINALMPYSNWQALKFGDDNFFELNYYESGKKEDGWVKFKWKVWVLPHN